MSLTLGGLVLLGLSALGECAKHDRVGVNAVFKQSKVITKNIESDLKKEQGGFVPDDDDDD